MDTEAQQPVGGLPELSGRCHQVLVLLGREPRGDTSRWGDLGVHASPCGSRSGRVRVEELGLEARSRILRCQEAVDARGDHPTLQLLDLRQGQELGLRRVGEVQTFCDHGRQVGRHPENPVGLGTGFPEAGGDALVDRAHPRDPVRREGRLDLLEQDAGQAGRLRVVDLVEGLGARCVGPSRRPAVVVDRDKRQGSQGVGNGGPLADRHVCVTAAGQRHRVTEVLEGELGVEGHHEVEVPLGQAVGTDGSGLRSAVPRVEHHVDGAERPSVVVDDRVTTRRADDRPVRKLIQDRQDHLVGAQDGTGQGGRHTDSRRDHHQDDGYHFQEETGGSGSLEHVGTVRHGHGGRVHRTTPGAERPPIGARGR